MKLVKLFVASSNELEDDRIHLGDCVRRVNDVYEQNGVRVKLYKWEDFSPFCTGKRSQDEYNEYLTQCDGVIGLFYTKVGDYTREEIEVALDKLGKDSVSCYVKVPSGSIHKDVSEFLGSKGFETKIYAAATDLYNIVIEVVDRLLHKGIKTFNHPEVSSMTYLYATIPDDNAEKRHQFGDVVRELDDSREIIHNQRCKLLPYKNPNKISSADAYVAIVKNNITKEDEEEVMIAKKELDNSALDGLLVYYENGGSFKHSRLWNEISSWGYFMPEYKTMSDVRWHLNQYLDRRIVKCSDDYMVAKGRLYANGIHMGAIEDISVFSVEKSTAVKIADIKELIHKQENRVSDLGVRVYEESDAALVDLSYEINAIDNELKKIVLMSVLGQSIWITLSKPAKTLLRQSVMVNNRLSESITSKVLKRIVSADEFHAGVVKHWNITRDIFNKGMIPAEKYFEIQAAWLMVYEKFYDLYPVRLYEEVLSFVDKHGIVNRRSEEIREDFSSFHCQKGDVDMAIQLHRKALDNYLVIDDDSVSFRKRLSQSYLNYCSIFLNNELLDIPSLRQAMDEWKERVYEWYGENEIFSSELGDYFAVLLRIQNMWGLLNKEQFKLNLIKVGEVFFKLRSKFDSLSNRAKGNFLYMGNMFATLYLDRPGEYASVEESYIRCGDYLKLTIDKALQYYTENAQDALVWLSMLYHNYAFLQRKTGHLNVAVSYYTKSLNFRRQILRKHQDADARDSVGETLVNLGDVLRELKAYSAAVDTAKEAIEEYQCSKDSSAQKLEVHDMNIYKSKQLLGSIYYEMDGDYKMEGLGLLKESWSWAVSHPGNTYMASFAGTSGRILKKEGLI